MDKYLLQILLETNTIIIPNLGALTITDVKSGDMMFMPYLKYDDGKLAEYISTKENMEINDAKNLIAKYVCDITARLDQGETYEMFEFGRFFKTNDGDIDFERWENFKQAENVVESITSETTRNEEQPTEIVSVSATDEMVAEQGTEAEPVNEEFISFESESETEASTEISTSDTFENLDSETSAHATHPLSLDEILAHPANETEIPEQEETAPELEEIVPVVETPKSEEKPITAETPTLKSDPVVDKTPDPRKVQVENTYISKSELAQKETEKSVNQPAASTPLPRKKKKRKGVGFWMLMTLIFMLASGTIVSLLFYDQVKEYIPFLEIKRAEIIKRSDSTEIAELLNESAEELENAEEARVESELNTTSESPTSETTAPEVAPKTDVKKPAAKPVEKPVVKPATKPVVKPVVKPAPQKSSLQIAENGSFHVIGGAFGEERNAIRYAEKLKSNGNNAQVIGKYNGLYLVSIESFATASEASNALQKLESVTGKAWIFKKP